MAAAINPAISDSLLQSFFEEASEQLAACDLKDADRESAQELSIYRKRVLEIQRAALEKTIAAANDSAVTIEAVQAELRNPQRMMALTKTPVKGSMINFNAAARTAFSRLVLHQECVWENRLDQRNLISTGRIERKALVEFCGLCTNVVQLPIVLKYLADNTKMFDDVDDSDSPATKDSELAVFPQKRLERIQQMMMRAVGYDSDFATAEVKRIFFTTATEGNEFDGDSQVHNLFANLGNMMQAAIMNATMLNQKEQLDDGQTKVVSVNYSSRDVGPGWDSSQSIGAPQAQSMSGGTSMQQTQLQAAREAAAMQQSILAELLQMDETIRERKLAEAKEAHNDFLKKAMDLPVGPERVQFMTSVDKDTNKLLLMHKLWANMLQQNGGKPPKMAYRK